MKNSANVGFEQKLWATADKLRGNIDPSEYKHIVLGLIFLKYISDTFENLHQKLEKEEGKNEAEDKDYYLAENIFWVPKEARWQKLKDNAKNPEIGKIIDDAMIAIEKDNKRLKAVLPKDYARSGVDKRRLGELIDLISTIELYEKENGSKDVFGRIYEYFFGKFASAEGKGGGEFYTPQSIVKVLVNMIEPYKGRVYDPCCGSGGMFVQSEEFVKAHGGKIDDIAVYGQESNRTTWRLCKMNLAVHGISADLGTHHADTFFNDLQPDLKADFILANPPFNISDWGGKDLQDDVRWKYGTPPTGNANYAWIQHFIHHLKPTGIAAFVMANGAMASNTSNEGKIRQELIKQGLVDCMVAMPDKLFYNVSIPCSLWFVSRDRTNHKYRNRTNEILFIDARNMGTMIDRRHRTLTDEDIKKISDTYHNWRAKPASAQDGDNKKYKNILGFCKSATIEEIEKNDYVLIPGRYVGFETPEEDMQTYEEKMTKLTKEFSEQIEKSKELDKKIKENLKKVGF